MRNVGGVVLTMAGFGVWACSGTVTTTGIARGGAAGMTETAQAGATQGGAPDGGATDGGEAGLRAVADAGASGEGVGGAAGAGAEGGSGGALDPGHFWDCEEANENPTDPSLVPSTEPSPLPSGAEATIEQLTGDWFHDSTLEYNGNMDYFHFEPDGTGYQNTFTTYWEVTWGTTYVGTITLAGHVITLDSTAGYSDSDSPLANGWGRPGSHRHEELPRQTLRYGYSYDAATDSLYVNNVFCTEPVRFERFVRP